jgi:putative pyruvate formate lyase activating enzyme
VRHLVMPGQTDQSKKILRFIAEEVSPGAYVNVMEQYRPVYKACDYPQINRPVTAEEYAEVRFFARDLGLNLL